MFLLNAPIGAPGLRSPSKKSRGSRLPSRRQPFRSLQQLWHSMLLALPLLWLLKEVGGNYSVGFTVSVNLVVVKLLYTEKQPPKRKKKISGKQRDSECTAISREIVREEAGVTCSFSVGSLKWWIIFPVILLCV